MTLGEFIKKYREEHGKMSIRSFADLVDISPQQIINIEKGVGNNGKPMTSTMKTYKKIAKAIGMDEKDFMNMLNDNVLVNPSDKKIPDTVSDAEVLEDNTSTIKECNVVMRTLTEENQKFALDFLKKLASSQQTQDE